MKLNIAELESLTGPAIYFLAEPTGSLDSQIEELEKRGFRVLRIANAKSKQQFMDEAALSCNMPEYFGRNWDALTECLRDLSWLPAKGYLFILPGNGFLEESEQDLKTALEILVYVSEFWRAENTAFRVLLIGSKTLADWLSTNMDHTSFAVVNGDIE